MKYFDHWTTAAIGIPALIAAIVALICAGYQAYEHFGREILIVLLIILNVGVSCYVWRLLKNVVHACYAAYI